MALNQFLAQIEDPQLAFGVRQKTPTTVDAAVAAALELETYLHPKMVAMPIARVDQPSEDDVIAAVTPRLAEKGGAQDPLDVLIDRVDKLIDAKLSATLGATSRTPTDRSQPRGRNSRSQRTITCYNCREEGHIARNCPAKKQGNGKPSEQ